MAGIVSPVLDIVNAVFLDRDIPPIKVYQKLGRLGLQSRDSFDTDVVYLGYRTPSLSVSSGRSFERGGWDDDETFRNNISAVEHGKSPNGIKKCMALVFFGGIISQL